MKAPLVLEISNLQQEVDLPLAWLEVLRASGELSWPAIREVALDETWASQCDVLDVAFVSRAVSDHTHRQFMQVAGATDVITFLHGELVICPAVALEQADEYGEPLLRELLRYLIHGMLHLVGYVDDTEENRRIMETHQERIVASLWCEQKMSDFMEVDLQNGRNTDFFDKK